jgi:periplasmic divalent cation tolerance protein
MAVPADTFRIVLTTAGSDEQADAIARALVERRLAACVNVVTACSVYRWKGEVTRDQEKLLVIKTTVDRVEALRQAVHELHSYELPELVTLSIDGGDPAYLAWLAASVD